MEISDGIKYIFVLTPSHPAFSLIVKYTPLSYFASFLSQHVTHLDEMSPSLMAKARVCEIWSLFPVYRARAVYEHWAVF